jgi:hypothetical protein
MKQKFFLPQILSVLGLAISFSLTAQQANGYLASNTKSQEPGASASYSAAPEKMALTALLEKGFAKAYPQASAPKWTKLDAGFHASFLDGGQKTTAVFQEDGKLSYAITELKAENMPVELQQFIKKEYAGSKLVQAVSIKDNSRTICQAILEHGTNYIKIKSSGEDMEVSAIKNSSASR